MDTFHKVGHTNETNAAITQNVERNIITESVKENGEYFLFMIYNDKSSIDRLDEILVLNELEAIQTVPNKTNISLIINSYGGNIYAAVKILNMIKLKCNYLRVVVPQWAKSAATLMCLGADEIVMGEQSELGPLDKPIEHPHLEGVTISALDVINALNHLQIKAKDLMFDIASDLTNKFFLNKKDAFEIACKISLGLVNPIMSKEDPRIISQSYRLLRIAEKYGKELIRNGSAKNWQMDEKRKEEFIDIILDIFVWSYPDHGFAITRQEAKSLRLKIVLAENFEKWNLLWNFYLLQRDKKLIKIYNHKQLSNLINQKAFL
jgi:hypothetical protein